MKAGVLGAGRQGIAAAYDLAKIADAEVTLVDVDEGTVTAAAGRINSLLGRHLVRPACCDVSNAPQVAALMDEWDVCASAVPYNYHLQLSRAAIESKCSFCDLGGNTDVVTQQLALDKAARNAGVSVIPDCGVGPGLIANLAVRTIELIEAPADVLIYDGGLLQNPVPGHDFALFFNTDGLTNEYVGDALYLIDGVVTRVPTFDDAEYEIVEVPGFGKLEAFVTAGGLSTMAATYEGKLRTLKNKTLRYPGHAVLIKSLLQLGFFDLSPVGTAEQAIVPRELANAILQREFAVRAEDRDVVVIHIVTNGTHHGAPATLNLDVTIAHDEATGFTGMERATGFHLAMVAAMMGNDQTPHGAVALEKAVDAAAIIGGLELRGISPVVALVQ